MCSIGTAQHIVGTNLPVTPLGGVTVLPALRAIYNMFNLPRATALPGFWPYGFWLSKNEPAISFEPFLSPQPTL